MQTESSISVHNSLWLNDLDEDQCPLVLTRSNFWFSTIISILLGILLGAGLLGLSLPLWLVIGSVLLLLAMVGWQLPYIRACLIGVPYKAVERPEKYLLRRVGLVLVLLAGCVLGYSVWWTQQPAYAEQIVEGFDEETGRVIYKDGAEHSLPLSYALKVPRWELGIVPLPKMIAIEAGSFEMGSDKGTNREKPVHTVTFATGFAMSQTEVTFAQYDYYVWRMQQDKIPVNYPHDAGWGRDDRPVVNVSWEDAQGYVNWLSQYRGKQCRLPSEAEWEYAARAGSAKNYSWGDAVDKNNANCDGCGSQWDNKQTAPVGSFPKNKFGLYDMHGNVLEWAQDRWHANYKEAPTDGTSWEAGKSSNRVLRGGSWISAPGDLRSTRRAISVPFKRSFNLGFRVVCSTSM